MASRGNRPMQVEPCFLPLTLNRTLRRTPQGADFSKRKPAEELQVHDFGERRVGLGQRIERVAQLLKIIFVADVVGDRRVERRQLELAAAFLGEAPARMVD